MIRIGPSGWTHPALDRAWPLQRGLDFDPLNFLGQYFGAVEVDVTAHVLPREEHIVRWAAALQDRPRTRLLVRVPSTVLDLSRAPEERAADAGRFRDSIAPLVRRERLGGLVATLADGTLFGPSEARALGDLARILSPAPLVLCAGHRSWYERRALDVLAGAGWSLAHLDEDERWDAPPRRHRATGPVGMLRLVGQGPYEPARIGEVARRAREISTDVEDLYVIADNAGHQGAAPASGIAAALEVKFVLSGEQPVPGWRRIVEVFPHLEALLDLREG
ncbi:DUF72 domain-containing protein [bacterium]|nr:DUF72 domain-containing protein [bacterium]